MIKCLKTIAMENKQHKFILPYNQSHAVLSNKWIEHIFFISGWWQHSLSEDVILTPRKQYFPPEKARALKGPGSYVLSGDGER